MLPDFSPLNPFRSPSWRWEAAKELKGTLRAKAFKADAWLKKTSKFRQQLEKATTPAKQAALAYDHEDIYWAWRVWEAISDERRRLLRHELEARILAEDSEERIQQLCGIHPDVLKAYKNVFFDVQDRLTQPAYVLHQVLGPKIHAGMNERDYELLWKLFGYCAGPKAVDALVNTMIGMPRPVTNNDIQSFLTSVAQMALRRKAVIAAHTIRPSDFTGADIIEKFLRLVEMERQQSADSAIGGIEETANSILQSLAGSFSAGLAKSTRSARLLEPYDQSAVELKYDEMMQITCNEEDPEIETIDVKFPDPPHHDDES